MQRFNKRGIAKRMVRTDHKNLLVIEHRRKPKSRFEQRIGMTPDCGLRTRPWHEMMPALTNIVSVKLPNPATIQRMPSVIDDNFVADMGGMVPQFPLAGSCGCSLLPTAMGKGRQKCIT